MHFRSRTRNTGCPLRTLNDAELKNVITRAEAEIEATRIADRLKSGWTMKGQDFRAEKRRRATNRASEAANILYLRRHPILATMPTAHRDELLQALPPRPWASPARIDQSQ